MLENFPQKLKQVEQWIIWRYIGEDKRKTPFQPDGSHAKANDPQTWRDFATCVRCFNPKRDAGLGFEFSKDDAYCGIDLDSCRNPETGKAKEWAREIIKKFDTYTEISPSETGFKLWCIGSSPFDSGKQLMVCKHNGCKSEQIEIYDNGRYFAATGLRVGRVSVNVESRQASLDWLKEKYGNDRATDAPVLFDDESKVVDRARRYVERIPGAVSGQNGHSATFHVACVLVLGFQLNTPQAKQVIQEWNQKCDPPWSDREIEHKINDASKQTGPRGYLRNEKPERFDRVKVPAYKPPPTPRATITTLASATETVLQRLRDGTDGVTPMGLPDLDYAIGGGVESGEMVVIGARPSHGKTAAAMQIIHFQTAMGIPSMLVSLEMSKYAIGKRTLQFATTVKTRDWHEQIDELNESRKKYLDDRAECYLVESCTDPDELTRHVEAHVEDNGVKLLVVDYAQLMHGRGKSKYEQISHVSSSLRELANKTQVFLVALCQLNREIESRKKFVPQVSDLRESGQLEQDADVIVFLVWPYRVDQANDPSLFQFFIAKNRNREIVKRYVECRFDPEHQKLYHDAPEYSGDFDTFNRSP